MTRIGVMHLIDSLEPGGAERVAVDSVNHLPRDRYRPFLCATRKGGPLLDKLAGDVKYLPLGRKNTVDLVAIWRLRAFVQRHDIQVLHAHSSSLFVALAASRLGRYPRVVWHMHYGGFVVRKLDEFLFRCAAARASAAIAVTADLREWAARRLEMKSERVYYVPNFVSLQFAAAASDLPGAPGKRIVCVANLRPPKDQIGLVRAMQMVVRNDAGAHLILAGSETDSVYANAVRAEIERRSLTRHVTLLGRRLDIPEILAGCDVGVLGSAIEGFPLSLIEYGAAGLPVVATRVGQCEEVLGGGAGVLVPPGDPEGLADAIVRLLQSAESRGELGRSFRKRVEARYNPRAITGQVSEIYERVLCR